jgi:tetratricopeptide (TPR) repeat protein
MEAGKDSSALSVKAQQHLELAYAYEERNEFESALRECELAFQLAPDWAEAHNLQGIVLEGLGRGEEAIAAYREAVRLDPAFREARENLLEAEGEFRKESKVLTKATTGTCVFCNKRETEPGSFIEVYWDVKETPVSARRIRVTYTGERVPSCEKCVAIVGGFKALRWGGVLLGGCWVAIRGLSDSQNLLSLLLGFAAGAGLFFLVLSPLFNFLTWALYTSKAGESLMHRMRMDHS